MLHNTWDHVLSYWACFPDAEGLKMRQGGRDRTLCHVQTAGYCSENCPTGPSAASQTGCLQVRKWVSMTYTVCDTLFTSDQQTRSLDSAGRNCEGEQFSAIILCHSEQALPAWEHFPLHISVITCWAARQAGGYALRASDSQSDSSTWVYNKNYWVQKLQRSYLLRRFKT